MSRLPRDQVIDHGSVGVYHCWNRFVRQLRLAGVDPHTGIDYSHRKTWFLERVNALACIFLIDVLSSVIMSTHYHLILRNRPDLAEAITDREVVRRWRALYPLRKDDAGRPLELTEEELERELANAKQVAKWRSRLSNISWFIKALTEPLARRANKEDKVKGAFFAHRFQCKRLEDEPAVIACMAYIELNEVRSGQCDRPEAAKSSSIWFRVKGWQARRRRQHRDRNVDLECAERGDADVWLCPINETKALPCLSPFGRPTEFRSDLPPSLALHRHGALPMSQEEFLKLVDWTGRQRQNAKASIPPWLAPILQRLCVREETWQELTDKFDEWFTYVAGRVTAMTEFAARAGLAWVRGLRYSRRAFT